MLTAIDLIARCESGCQPPRVDRGMVNSSGLMQNSTKSPYPNALISGRSLRRPEGRGSTTGCPAALIRSAKLLVRNGLSR